MAIQSLTDVPAATTALLQGVFADRATAAAEIGPGFADAVTALSDFVLRGGKRVRPTFAWAGYLASGPTRSDPDRMLSVCAALELVQACALVHDDIIDRSDTRRGFPTVHREFEARHRAADWNGDAAGYGEGVAILLGDLALAWADDLVTEAGFEPQIHRSVSQIWRGMRTEVLGGQFLDIATEASGDETAIAAYRVMRFKTAAYTVERPLHLGAAIGGAEPDLIASLRTFGTDIGIAFQLRDDLLGVFGDPAITGKPAGDDIIAGKRTALLSAALGHLDEHDRAAAQTLRDRVGRSLTADELAQTLEILTASGAVAEVEQQIDDLVTTALATLSTSSATDAAKADLAELAAAMTRRQY